MEDSTKVSTGRLVGAAARGYEIIRNWEESAPLDSDQLAVIDLIAKHHEERALPPHLVSSAVSEITTPKSTDETSRTERQQPTEDIVEMDRVVLNTTQEFYKWYGKLEALRVSEAEEQYNECVSQLQSQLQVCQDSKSLIQNTLTALDHILELYKNAVGK